MKSMIKNRLYILLVAVIATTGCTKQKIGPLTDNKPAVPVTVPNAIYYRPEPTVTASKAGGGAISITLSIAAPTGVTLKEITKVAASTTYSQIQSTGTTGFYTSAPIAGSGTTATFTTTLAEYVTKTGGTIPASNTELARRFYFMITLSDGSIIITEPVRVLVID
jgi:hypothetical protein